jgi:hypothetical protein
MPARKEVGQVRREEERTVGSKTHSATYCRLQRLGDDHHNHVSKTMCLDHLIPSVCTIIYTNSPWSSKILGA